MAKVKVENGKSVTMSELQIGVRVKTGVIIIKFIFWRDYKTENNKIRMLNN